MKTNIVLKSCDRNLFGVTIRQNTKEDQSLSVSDLVKAYETARLMYGWSDRKINHITDTVEFSERCYYILEEKGFINTGITVFMESVKNEGIVKVLKSIGVWKTKGRGENKSVFVNPYIWVLLAMELNPKIYAKVIIWLTDTLIFNRIDAGDEFKPMTLAISTIIDEPNYGEYFMTINKKVFGKHEKGIRDTASAEQLRKISDIEKFVTQSINMGMISNEVMLRKAIFLYK